MSTDQESVTKIGYNVFGGGAKATVARSQSEVSTPIDWRIPYSTFHSDSDGGREGVT